MTAMERLNSEQKKLQVISTRIEEKLNEAVEAKTESQLQVSKVKLPRELSVSYKFSFKSGYLASCMVTSYWN